MRLTILCIFYHFCRIGQTLYQATHTPCLAVKEEEREARAAEAASLCTRRMRNT